VTRSCFRHGEGVTDPRPRNREVRSTDRRFPRRGTRQRVGNDAIASRRLLWQRKRRQAALELGRRPGKLLYAILYHVFHALHIARVN
jgi:hypothetical protein